MSQKQETKYKDDPNESSVLLKKNEKVTFIKIEDKEPIKDRVVSYFQLYRYATLLDKFLIILAVILSALCGFLQLYSMFIYGKVTGIVIEYAANIFNDTLTDEEKAQVENKLLDGVHVFIYQICAFGFITILATHLSVVFFNYTASRQIFQIRKLFLKQTLNKDIGWFDTKETGDFATIFTDNLSKIEEGISEKIGLFIFYEIEVIVGCLMALYLGWKLALVSLAILPISSGCMAIITWVCTKFSKEELKVYSVAGSIAEEVFSSIRTVVAFGGEEKEVKRYEKHLIEAKKSSMKKLFFTALSSGWMWFFTYAGCAVSVWYGVVLMLADRHLPADQIVYTPGNIVGIYFLAIMVVWNFGMVGPYLDIFGTACGAASKVFEALDSEPVINQSKTAGMTLSTPNSEIEFSGIDFAYPSRPDVQVLRNFSLSIKMGETVAFVGSSGCGKSTCVQLIQRFYDPTSGSILIGGTDIRSMNLSWLRSQIGVVGQEPALFATSIWENIKYGKMVAGREEIVAAAKRANAHDFIMKLPYGYDTVVGERGTQLSGGQKQRIAIARALIRQPKILLLDEATSALDTTSEAEVQAALNQISVNCTTIIVAHRLSTIRNADRIVVIDQGEVIELGVHAELMKAKGAYYNLVISHNETETPIQTGNDNGGIAGSSGLNVQKMYISNGIKPETTEADETVKTSIFSILKLNKPEWMYIVSGCLFSVITGASVPLYGVFIGDILGVFSNIDIDYVRRESNLLTLYIFILAVVTAVGTFLQMYSFGISGAKLTLRLRSNMFSTMLRQEICWFDDQKNSVGALCAKLASEASSVEGASGVRVGTLLNSFATFTITSIVAIYFQWKLALVLLSLSPLILISVFFENKFMQGYTKTNLTYLENSANVAVEAIVNLKTVASLGCEDVFYNRYVDALKPYVRNVQKQSHCRGLVTGIARCIVIFVYALGVGYGIKLMLYEGLTYGVLFKVSEVVIGGSWSIGQAFAFSPNFQEGLSSASRIFQMLQRTPKVKNAQNTVLLSDVNGDIKYKKVDFAYPTRPLVPVLTGLDLSIEQGQSVALVGESGCGKSTIIQLLQRFYDVKDGQVLLDNEQVKMFDMKNLRSYLGVVSQEPNLFDRTIAENIAYGANHRQVLMEEVVDAAKMANIHSFIVSLPQGYETNLGSRGMQLSGGQKQRVAIARALIRNPRILLLDEATSALDNESEKVVQEALDNAKQGRTCITIAHRLQTIQGADVICVVAQGKVVEMGKHEELIKKRGVYFDFYKLQQNN